MENKEMDQNVSHGGVDNRSNSQIDGNVANNTGKGKGNKKKGKGKDNFPKDKKKGGIPWRNDWTFYAANEQIAKDIASIPFNFMNGTKFPISMTQTSVVNDEIIDNGKRPLPGVLCLKYIPSVGVTNYRTDGINMAATQLYTFVRHANSGAKNYEPADLMMYILALKDIYAEYFEIKRAIGIASTFNYYNHNLPDLILQSLGIDPEDLRHNIANYRGKLNVLAEKINSFAVPSYFKAFDRSTYISSYVFSDSTSIRGQFYVFKKQGYYYWSGTTSQTGTELVYEDSLSDAILPLSEKFKILEAQLNQLFLDEDALTMSGDILKAFKEAKLYTVQSTAENYKVVPIHDTDILAQIENCVMLTPVNDKDILTSSYLNLNIKQEEQLIKFKPQLRYTSGLPLMFNFHSHVFNSHKDEPQYTDVLEWTRLMATFKDEATTTGENEFTHVMTVESCGLELITDMKVYTYNGDGETTIARRVPQVVHSYSAEDGNSNLISHIADLTQFDWHPFLYVVDHILEGSNPDNHIHILGDCKVVTTIENNTLKTINDSACYSAYFARDLY